MTESEPDMPMPRDDAAVERLRRRGLALEYATLGWNVVGIAVMFVAAWLARSVALVGFGLDSLIEIFASLVVIWQLQGGDPARERRAMRLIGGAFFALAAYVLVQSFVVFATAVHARPSVVGMLWLAITVVLMLALAYGKHDTGTKLGNVVLATEARVTFVDAMLALAVLVGIALNAILGWWWADPAAALVIVVYGFREGRHAWREGS